MTKRNQMYRLLWSLVWFCLARPFPRSSFNRWKTFLLRLFGASIDSTAAVYSTANVYMPCNLKMGPYSCLAGEVDCYNVAPVLIGANVTISQKSYLCTASHDIYDSRHALITSPIIIEDQVWVGASSFIGMGVTLKQGAVVGAMAAVFKNVDEWSVVGGNPAKFLKHRIIKE